jgi:hypothetical protein
MVTLVAARREGIHGHPEEAKRGMIGWLQGWISPFFPNREGETGAALERWIFCHFCFLSLFMRRREQESLHVMGRQRDEDGQTGRITIFFKTVTS